MDLCKVHTYLAYAMAVYTLASLYYYLRTRSLGTPFSDSLNPTQRAIKEASADARRNIFMQGALGAFLLLVLFRPFASCQ